MQPEGYDGGVSADDSYNADVRGGVEDACSIHAEPMVFVGFFLVRGMEI
jgi:hypothetical protein